MQCACEKLPSQTGGKGFVQAGRVLPSPLQATRQALPPICVYRIKATTSSSLPHRLPDEPAKIAVDVLKDVVPWHVQGITLTSCSTHRSWHGLKPAECLRPSRKLPSSWLRKSSLSRTMKGWRNLDKHGASWTNRLLVKLRC